MYFNARVLQEAADPSTPLIERIKFLGIFSNNLDEFYRVRVATLNRMVMYNKKKNNPYIDFDPQEILDKIGEIEFQQQKQFANIYRHIVRELSNHNIYLVDEKTLKSEHGSYVKKYFRNNIRPHLFPIMLSNFEASSSLKDKSIYLAIDLKSNHHDVKERYALMKVPSDSCPRFIILPEIDGNKYIILLDDVIRYSLSDIFDLFGYDEYDAYTVKFTRDAELDIDNDVSKSFIDVMAESLKQRKAGTPVRFIYDKSMPANLLKTLTRKLGITKNDTLTPRGRYHNFKDFMKFPNVGSRQMEHEHLPSLVHPDLPINQSIMAAMKEKDIMLHYPYQTFQHIIDLLREASIDPKVRAIKMTLYRVARDSNVINALKNAARNGKQVTVFLELQARFDEEANIYWSQTLQNEGVKIIQGIPGFKVHGKLLLIRRKEDGENVYYANIGTGNFNEETARIYADDGLLTANPALTNEVNKVFYLFESKYNPPRFKELVVGPFSMRNFYIKLLNREIRAAKEGKEAWVILKMNSLVDKKIVRKLISASKAGVKIKLVIRGICVLVPGIPGISDKIEAISIVDRFLEHSRVFIFCNQGDPLYYISSADWMVRNFDHRIEVAVPVYNKEIKQELWDMLQIQLSDNDKARLLDNQEKNDYKQASTGAKAMRSQVEIYRYLKRKQKKMIGQREARKPEEVKEEIKD